MSQTTRSIRTRRAERRAAGGCLGWLRTGCLGLLALLIMVVLGGALVALVAYGSLARELDDGLARLTAYDQSQNFQTTQILDRNGVLLYEIFDEGKRTRIPLKDIPPDLINATIATEDRTFWENPGVDAPAIAGFVLRNLMAGEIVGGGSTITQQLVRHVAFSYEERTEQTLRRKVKEALLAVVLTRMKSKEEILELYLNEINYGNLAYGVEAAAQTYFGKSARELTRAEAAMLAGMPQAPSVLDPYNPNAVAQNALAERRRIVLDLMVRHGYLTRAEADATLAEELHWAPPPQGSLVAPHFVVYVRQLLEDLHGPELVARGGLRVYTTLDTRYQALAEDLARAQVAAVGQEHHLTNMALIALKPGTGEILAMLGSVDYADETIQGRVNVALSERQPGSAIKPLTYALAFEQGLTPASVFWDVETRFPQFDGSAYVPVNYDRKFHGPVRVRDALANSYNIPAVLALQRAGVPELIDFAHRLGIGGLQRGASDYGLSLTLGGGEVTLLDLAGAYGVFANGGRLVKPVAILRVEDSQGHVLDQYPGARATPVLDPRVAYQITSILADNVARTPMFGPNSALLLDRPAAAKTGTTNDYHDNWTVGYTPGLVVGVWAGNADNTPMINVSGVQGAAPVWHNLMTAVYADPALRAMLDVNGAAPPDDFAMPSGMQVTQVCVLAGLQDPAVACPEQRTEVLLASPAWAPGAPAATPDVTPSPAATVFAVPNRVMLDAGLYRVRVLPVSPEIGAQLIAWLAAGEPPPAALAPLAYCAVPDALGQPQGSVEQLFVPGPPPGRSALEAAAWAQQHGTPMEPPPCDQNLINQAGGGGSLDALWTITSPRAGEVITQAVPVLGTARFTHANVLYYKVEIGTGALDEPDVWAYLGGGPDPVENGVLAMLPGDALPPGAYILRLVLVKTDGNFPPPYEVQVTIAR